MKGSPTHSGPESSSSSAGEALLESLLHDLLELPAEQRPLALAAMCGRHPDQAEVLRRRLLLLETSLPPAEETPPGLLCGRFQPVRCLGGGMAEVHVAIDTHNGAQVVLKLLRHPQLLDATTRGSFAREVQAAARLRHPCIGEVLECSEHDGVPYLVQPYVPGITLAQWIRQRQERGRSLGSADVELVLGWLEEILHALHAAHEAGLVHRDVKPANILLPFQGRPRLLDFGLCRETGPRDPAGTPTPAAGTLAYMAPELLTTQAGPPGPAADLYAVGVTLCEALTLRLPFSGNSLPAQSRAILLQEPADLRSALPIASRGLRRVLAAALARAPGDRYGNALEFADDLRRVRLDHRVRAPRANRWRAVRRWATRHPWLATLTAPLLALAVLPLVPALLANAADRQLAFLGLAERVRGAIASAEALVPGRPEQVPALAEWLRTTGEPLAQLLPELRTQLAGPAPAAIADDPALALLRAGHAALEAFVAEPRGTLPVLRRRLQWAQQAADRTLVEPAAAWQETIAAIAADPLYGGLRLAPQLDLVPLGRDRKSGLFEFYHPRSAWPGSPPVGRDPTTGALDRHPFAGMVFVLVPGGECLIGEQPFRADEPRYDPLAAVYARPHRVPLAPFFLSKYEMTRQQWRTLVGGDPSHLVMGTRTGDDPPIGYDHPVESVSATQCDAAMREAGLVLPTEAQWEWACGGDAPTRWFFGDDPAELFRYGNVDDRRYHERFPGTDGTHAFDDGFAGLAPVGRFRPNRFGLYDMEGNVAEWCRDDCIDYAASTPRPGDGLRVPGRADGLRSFRGSRFWQSLNKTSSRPGCDPSLRNFGLGLRPARAVLESGR